MTIGDKSILFNRLGLAGALCAVATLDAQTVRVIDNAGCNGCITVERIATIDGSVAPLFGWPPQSMVRDRKGRYIVLSEAGAIPPRMPQVFDSRGEYLSELSRAGLGPGELNRPRWLQFDAHDTLRVYQVGKVSIFANLAFVRQETLRTPSSTYRAWRLRDGTLATLSAGGANGFVVDLRNPQGESPRPLRLGGTPFYTERTLAIDPASNGSAFWVAEYARDSIGYRIMRADTASLISFTYRREPSWWRPRLLVPGRIGMANSDTTFRPSAQVGDLQPRTNGTVLLLLRRPRVPWRAVRRDEMWGQVHDAVVEMLDVRAGTLVGSVEVRGYGLQFVGDGEFATYREDDLGFPYIDIWRLAVR